LSLTASGLFTASSRAGCGLMTVSRCTRPNYRAKKHQPRVRPVLKVTGITGTLVAATFPCFSPFFVFFYRRPALFYKPFR
jgi:hypothetical protein